MSDTLNQTSESKFGIVEQPHDTCPTLDKAIALAGSIEKLIRGYEREEDVKNLHGLLSDVEWNVSGIPSLCDEVRDNAGAIRQWGQEWKDKAKDLERELQAEREKIKELEMIICKDTFEMAPNLRRKLDKAKAERDQAKAELLAWHESFGCQPLSHAITERDILRSDIAHRSAECQGLQKENEQLRKERDELKACLVEAVESFEAINAKMARSTIVWRDDIDRWRKALGEGEK